MKPQPPVTRIRTATASSAQPGALADFPLLGDSLETWRRAFAESEWTRWIIVGLATFLRLFRVGFFRPFFDRRGLDPVFPLAVLLRRVRPLEIRRCEISLLRRDGSGGNDSFERDLHPPCFVRYYRGASLRVIELLQ